MKHPNKRWPIYLLMAAAIILTLISVILLARIVNHHNWLSLQRQDSQLEDLAQATDAIMASQLSDFREELRYVIGRRGFLQAEELWHTTGNPAELLVRMQENLIAHNPLVHTMLAMQGDSVLLSSAGPAD